MKKRLLPVLVFVLIAAVLCSCTSAQTTPSGSVADTSETTVEQTKTTAADAESNNTCFVTIDCQKVLQKMDDLKKSKRQFVPEGGYILKDASVKYKKGETAFDVIKRVCKENVCTDSCKYCQDNGIQIEYTYSQAYQSYYIQGIHQLYEKDCGSLSGWMFSVNGEYPETSMNAYEVKQGDVIVLEYYV